MPNLLTILKPSILDSDKKLLEIVNQITKWGNFEHSQYREQLYVLTVGVIIIPILIIAIIDSLIYNMFQRTSLNLDTIIEFLFCVLSIGLASLILRCLYYLIVDKTFHYQVAYIINRLRLGNPDVKLAVLTEHVDKLLDTYWR